MNQSQFCGTCGQPLPAGSRFCNGCGAALAAPVAAAAVQSESVARQPGALPTPAGEERIVFVLRPTMLFVYCWYALATVILIATSAVLGLSSGLQWVRDYWYVVILAVGLLAYSVPLFKHVMRMREVYTLTTFKLEMRYGLLAKSVRNIPLNKIQDVTVSSSAWQRLVSLGDILIDSASETGKIHIDDVRHPERYADLVLAELRRRN